MTSTEIGVRIRQARIEAGFSQERFAVVLGTSQRRVSGWERGQSDPRISTLVRISKATAKPIQFFFEGWDC